MGKGTSFRRLDAFAKVAEDARIRTTSGGLVTLICFALISILITSEFLDWRRITETTELVVDKTRGERMTIHLNLTFAHIPCSMLSLDVMDVSGETQIDLKHEMKKRRETRDGKVVAIETASLNSEAAPLQADDYCGPCYGATPPESGCCNTCEDVRDAYARSGWAIGDLNAFEQCEKEHYKDKLGQQVNEGCTIAGSIHVNKVQGNFHFAPGKSFSGQGGQHVHDLNEFGKSAREKQWDFSHTINEMRFGDRADGYSGPLEGTSKSTTDSFYNYVYFIKTVATRWEFLSGKEAIETNQYSVTGHERSLAGGLDPNEPHHVHSRGGIPGVFFSYDISPIKVINRQVRNKTFGGFLVGSCAAVGGLLAMATMLDRGVWETQKRLKDKKTL
ncbi:DUF1692-domain-containing protein [Saitoella complicata NRRL Y-17804]|nr:DUF1692-domain-containing protein [Saitoella complicata NRRL Y-17804]ODQ51097.1 DUF1692-domain-containing protein [Saitoella complicata NRRL Y-17804]